MKSIDPHWRRDRTRPDDPMNDLEHNDQGPQPLWLTFLLFGTVGVLAGYSIGNLFLSAWYALLSAVVGTLVGVKFITPKIDIHDTMFNSNPSSSDGSSGKLQKKWEDEATEESIFGANYRSFDESENGERGMYQKFLANAILSGDVDDFVDLSHYLSK